MNTLFFKEILLLWYQSHKRDLPWRDNPTPYHIWISEIILQQTRINQGINYYNRFIEKYPDCASLASASEEEVLKLWQGLGYYSRARNLHAASQQIQNEFGGVFPSDFQTLKKLKGIGEYTAAAIASIAFNETIASIDGNVYRVLSRIFAIDIPINSAEGKKYFQNLASQLIDPLNPGDFNQAVMEFGALQCTPSNPDCTVCPLMNGCLAYQNESIKSYPVKIRCQKVRDRFFNYLIIKKGPSIYFHKRVDNDIWKNLYDFPLIETTAEEHPREFILSEEWKNFFHHKKIKLTGFSEGLTHQLSHQRIHVRFYHVKINFELNLGSSFILINKKDIFELPVPTVIERYLTKTDLDD